MASQEQQVSISISGLPEWVLQPATCGSIALTCSNFNLRSPGVGTATFRGPRTGLRLRCNFNLRSPGVRTATIRRSVIRLAAIGLQSPVSRSGHCNLEALLLQVGVDLTSISDLPEWVLQLRPSAIQPRPCSDFNLRSPRVGTATLPLTSLLVTITNFNLRSAGVGTATLAYVRYGHLSLLTSISRLPEWALQRMKTP